MEHDVVVVGGGVAGLACAGRLKSAGRRVVVLEKSRGVGGRCATRRIEGQPVDHGLAFYHGDDPEFLALLERASPETLLPGWPTRVEGRGAPCQPRSFARGERRCAFSDGVTALPKHLALDLDVRLATRVVSWRSEGATIGVATAEQGELRAPDLVLALPLPQARELLGGGAAAGPAGSTMLALTEMLSSAPCLTWIAGYPASGAVPGWEMNYPEDSRILALISHDSSKRRGRPRPVLVYQALPGWSRRNRAADPDAATREVLAEAARRIGDWAARPEWVRAHRWRYARAEGGSELARPCLFGLPGGQRIGLAGEVFGPGGGVQAAWLSGGALADRLLEEPR